MVTAITLIVLAVIPRLVFPIYHIWNFIPIGAMALYAGSRLPRRWAWAVPVAAMVVSDIILDYGTHRPIFELTRWTVYLTLAAMPWFGRLANRPKFGPWLLPVLALSGSTIFHITSNLATWGEGQLYPLTLAGLADCFNRAWPFYKSTILADLVGTLVLFSLGPVVERVAGRLTRPWSRKPLPELEAIPSRGPA
jgi:hypothetical protein